jgi:hypothetical protein
MKCPSCAAPASDDAAECPACGLIFAKWRERREKEKLAAVAALAALEAPGTAAPSAPNPWIARGIAGAVVAAWLLGFGLYLLRNAAKRRPPLGVDTGVYVQMRDPRTGDMRRMPVRRVGGVPGPNGSGAELIARPSEQ